MQLRIAVQAEVVLAVAAPEENDFGLSARLFLCFGFFCLKDQPLFLGRLPEIFWEQVSFDQSKAGCFRDRCLTPASSCLAFRW